VTETIKVLEERKIEDPRGDRKGESVGGTILNTRSWEDARRNGGKTEGRPEKGEA